MSSRDRDFRPTRRRGYDDDNFETPRRSFGSPPGSSAQRFDAPSGPPVQAVVKWYNPDKGFGFVQLADGSGDAFLHVSVVERSGHGSVPPGAMLEVRAGPGPKGPQVSEILSVDSSTAQQEPPRRARPERPMYPPADRAAVEEAGTVKWYNAIKGFGFIASDRRADGSIGYRRSGRSPSVTNFLKCSLSPPVNVYVLCASRQVMRSDASPSTGAQHLAKRVAHPFAYPRLRRLGGRCCRDIRARGGL